MGVTYVPSKLCFSFICAMISLRVLFRATKRLRISCLCLRQFWLPGRVGPSYRPDRGINCLIKIEKCSYANFKNVGDKAVDAGCIRITGVKALANGYLCISCG